jgi:hypothetical protein
LGLALTIVGPEAGRGDSTLGGLDFEAAARSRSSATIGLDAADLLTLGLPLGFFWAKPVMAKLNPNISTIAVFFIISTTIVKLATPHALGDHPFRLNLLPLNDRSNLYDNFVAIHLAAAWLGIGSI